MSIDVAISQLRKVDAELKYSGWRIDEDSTRERLHNVIKLLESAKAAEQPDYSNVSATDGLGNVTHYQVGQQVAHQPDEWRGTYIAKLNKRNHALRSCALEMVAHVRQYDAAPGLRQWADDIEKRVWEAEGLNDE